MSSKQVFLKEYSEKCIVIIGNTMPVKNYILNNGGKYNPGLWIEEKKIPCYIFPKVKINDVTKLVNEINNNFDKYSKIDREKDDEKEIKNIKFDNIEKGNEKIINNDFIFTKEKYLALISRIEKLESDNSRLLQLLNKNNKINCNTSISSESEDDDNEEVQVKTKRLL